MRYIRKSAIMANDYTSNEHVIGGVTFGAGGVVIDVDHLTGSGPNIRVGQSRYIVPAAELDWSLGDPSEAALAWLISDLGPLVGGEIVDVDPLEIVRQLKLAAVAKASAAIIAQATQAADDMRRRVEDAGDLDELEQIAPETLTQGTAE